MPGLFDRVADRVAKAARSPKGQRIISQATAKAQQLANDPRNRERVQRVRDEVDRRMNGRRRPPAT